MKIIDIRYCEHWGWVADVLLSPRSVLPVSIPVLECDVNELIDFANTDPEHVAIYDPRLPIEKEMDTLFKEQKETYQALM